MKTKARKKPEFPKHLKEGNAESNHLQTLTDAHVPPSQSSSFTGAELRTFAGFIVLDAIICNTDAHHDN